jgi:hypothetical protein
MTLQNSHINPTHPESSEQAVPTSSNINYFVFPSVSANFFEYLNKEISESNLLSKLPYEWGLRQSSSIVISHVKYNDSLGDNKAIVIDKSIIINRSETRILLNNISREYNAEVTKFDNLITLIEKIDKIILCNGSGIRRRISRHCSGENTRKKKQAVVTFVQSWEIIKTKQKPESIEAYNVKEENSKSVQPIKAKNKKNRKQLSQTCKNECQTWKTLMI